ncbi:PREDICTED: putative leucine-rich repeat-containing protein DDB_G0290503 isoform X1 [Trachymyrmex septentrionalis]|uniref:putative leucine-rich repeat-containing protein DDB_G0290503 isoform X1 n=3 Tax=Trachymyrmex septentrionalis TaxID=34720 RepID=UPI00084F8449|nr:PREDICTED: putative leucine-rich repeat-containing protein DDB_G0290503 isoform X1 [Trachymyrmex septentrionalis]
MGASSSSSGPPALISTSEHEVETLYPEDACSTNNGRQRMYIGTSIYKDKDQSRSQDPSPYATLGTSEFWDQRPTAPSLSNMLPSKRETLLTCAAQMTGWQSADSYDHPMCQQNNEIVELSRIISQLAMANHQLASTHSATLARMETLYLELSKDRENRKQKISTENLEICGDIPRKRLYDENIENEETRRLEQRVLRLEELLATSSFEQCKQHRHLQEDNKLHFRTERSEDLLKTQDTKNENSCSSSTESRCESSEQRSSHIVTDVIGEIPDDFGDHRGTASKETDFHIYCGAHSDDSVTNIPTLDENSCSLSVDLDKVRRRRARLRNDAQDSIRNSASEEIFMKDKEIFKLSEEVEKLKANRLKFQSANERLLCNLTDQKNLVEKLSVNYEELKTRYVTVEANLHENRQQYNELTKHLDYAKKEIERLLKEINIFQSEKDTADARISILEENLQKSQLDTQQIKNVESQKISELRTQLSDELLDKNKQIKALEDALQEIQRLKEIIKTERRNEDDVVSREDIDIVDSIDDTSENTSNPNYTSSSLDEFRKELTLKREARHRAIAAVSSEMERLRRELDAEKKAHSETSSMLAQLRSVYRDSQDLDLVNGDFVKTTMREQECKHDENEKALKRAEAQRLTRILKVSDELRNDVRYQIEKVDDFRYHLETDPERHRQRIHCLTEVTNKARTSLIARERETNELKNYLAQLLVRLGDRSFLEIQDDAGIECDRQLENINALKSLYNERLKVLTELKDSATRELVDVKQKMEYALKKSENLEEELKRAEDKVDAQDSEITNLESQLGLTKADCRDLQNQMSLINGLFTQMLLGASSADMDLDRLTQLLQENHDLISDIAREESTEAAALPKLLLDLIEQVEGGKASQKHANEENSIENIGEVDRKEDDLQEEDIAHNLPKVWRVLLELLSCHAVTSPSVSVASCSDPNSCYKSVDTPAGPRLVISVSKTYIRLKELILEKKHLEKEMNRMKQLNTHLESKLGEQEKRLSMVSVELTKTWNIVGRMQAQHQQLHTHEEILRYELQEKRKMLQELKQELEYCREKWESARQKNTNTEREWRNLRREFAARKALAVHDSFNSAESGFSDERGDDTDEEEEAIEGRIRHGPRRRTRKESPRAPTPDTESEQPTDTELSESKTGSSVTLEQRTPTPETEAELDEAEIVHIDSELINTTEADSVMEGTQEILDPLDQALTNVIQNLIKIDHGEGENVSASRENMTSFDDLCNNPILETNDDTKTDQTTTFRTDLCDKNTQSSTLTIESRYSSPDVKILKQTITITDLPSTASNGESFELSSRNSSRQRDEDDDSETIKSESIPSSSVSDTSSTTVTNTINTMSVFSIGPLPASNAASSSIKSVQFSNPLIMGPSNRFLASVFGMAATEMESFMDNCIISSPNVWSFSSAVSSQEENLIEGTDQRSSKLVDNIVDSDNVSVDSSSSLDTVREFPTANVSSMPSTSVPKDELQESGVSQQKETTTIKSRTPEEVLATRADRLKRLEEQADWLMKKMNATSKRGNALCTRLEELHNTYGEPPVPPPMPDVLPSYRLPCTLPNLPRQVKVPESLSDASNIKNIETESSNTV